MKNIILILITTLSLNAQASEGFVAEKVDVSSWALGVNYGVANIWERIFGTDLQLPAFTTSPNWIIGSTIDLDLRDLGVAQIRTSFSLSYSLLFRRPLYKELVSSYLKVGVGYAFVDELLHKDAGFVFIPFTFGADLITFDIRGNASSFFVETGFNFDFEDDESGADIFDGTYVNIGVRSFF